jgi:hypothetical protein
MPYVSFSMDKYKNEYFQETDESFAERRARLETGLGTHEMNSGGTFGALEVSYINAKIDAAFP